MAHILLVDDDEQYRSVLNRLLTEAGHVVVEVPDGVAAQGALSWSKFDLTISDIRMPKCDGVELLKWMKKQCETPIVLITGFSEILEAAQASKIGADGFLAKPFKFEEIQKLIQEVLLGNKSSDDVDIDDQYCRVPVESFITGSNIHFNIYHRISSRKYLKIANRGEDIADSRIEAYKAKGMRNLFLTKEDFAKYVGFNLTIARRLQGAASVSAEKKAGLMSHTGELITEQLFLDTINKSDFESAKDFVTTTLDVVQEQDQVFSVVDALNRHADFLYAHSLGVSLYSVMVARKLKWHWTPKLFKIALAGLFHDIGLKEIPREVIEKPRLEMTQEERRLFESHAVRGMELLNQVPGMPEDVILAAYQHHENQAGQGYPQKLHHLKIHPVARLIALVDAFCDLTISRPGHEKYSVKEALKQMASREAQYDPEYFLALQEVFLLESSGNKA